jgi:post-segregation antitoxin (ccd killing protein)
MSCYPGTRARTGAALCQQARIAQVNLSVTLEHALIEELKLLQQQKWRAENREAIATYTMTT